MSKFTSITPGIAAILALIVAVGIMCWMKTAMTSVSVEFTQTIQGNYEKAGIIDSATDYIVVP